MIDKNYYNNNNYNKAYYLLLTNNSGSTVAGTVSPAFASLGTRLR